MDYTFDRETYNFLVMTSLKTGSAIAFQFDKNIFNAILTCLDTGSIAVSATLYDAQGAEMVDGNVALCEDRCEGSRYYMSLFASGDDYGSIMPFYNGFPTDRFGTTFDDGCSVGTYRISLGKFSPEELKSVGNLKIKVGHMKDNQFSE